MSASATVQARRATDPHPYPPRPEKCLQDTPEPCCYRLIDMGLDEPAARLEAEDLVKVRARGRRRPW